MINLNTIQRVVMASALSTGLLSIGVAASAQTALTPAVTTTATVNATNVSMTTVTSQPNRQAELEQANADARRIAFRHQGTSL